MIKIQSIPTEKAADKDICSNCANAQSCVYIKNEHKPVWECELFVTGSEKEQKAPAVQKV